MTDPVTGPAPDPMADQLTAPITTTARAPAAEPAPPEGPGLLASTKVMALGTIASRATGLISKVLLAWAVGKAVGDAYNVANTIPNIVYELLLGGVLTSVLVPLIVKAAAGDGDAGEAYSQRLLTLVAVTLGVTTLVAIAIAPWLVRLYIGHFADVESRAELDLATTFARVFLPQIFFYGVGATIGAVLNTRGRFAAPMWSPVLNNVVVIVTLAVFFVLPGPARLRPGNITTAQTMTLAIGTTLGIVAQTVALLPSLRATGFRWRARFDFRGVGLREAGRLAGWVLLYVLVNQLAYVVITNLATSALEVDGRHAAGGYSIYTWAYLLFQLPHAIIAVSVITALLPRMSRHAVEDRPHLVARELSRGIRLSSVVLVPAMFGFIALNQPIARVLFGHFQLTTSDAQIMGWTLAAYAVGTVPFSVFQLQLRAFYAMRDTRTPALVNIAVNVANLAIDLVAFEVLPARWIVPGLAFGYTGSYAVGVLWFNRVLAGRLGSVDGYRIVRTLVRLTVAGAGGAALAYLVAAAAYLPLGRGTAGSVLGLVVGVPVGSAFFLWVAARLRVGEVGALAGMVRARVGRAAG